MTATPIPRSLALALYGDLKFTAIRQMPVGRRPVTTELVIDGDRAAMNRRRARRVGQGSRASSSSARSSKPAKPRNQSPFEAESERLKTEFPDTEIVALPRQDEIRGQA